MKSDFFIVATTVVASAILFYVSDNPLPYSYYFYLRCIAAVGLLFGAVYFYKKYGSSNEAWLSNLLILIYLLTAGLFMFHKTNRLEWLQIDKAASLFMLVPVINFVYSVYKTNQESEVLGRIKSFISSLLNFAVGIAIVATLYYVGHSKESSEQQFSSLSIKEQLVNLYWTNYTENKWLTLYKDNTFTIEVGRLSDEEMKEIGKGQWSFDPYSSVLTLNSNGLSKKYYYKNEGDSAYLGTDPIESSSLGEIWLTIVPDKI